MDKAAIFAEGVKRRILLAPVASVADIAADGHLAARNFFADVADPASGRSLRMPGAFAKFSRTPMGAPTAAPRLGEHNADVFGGLLGLGSGQIDSLKASGAI
jgi:crotonobetainyl-CoA:carnitine CoA-transferase CaiB-like acyl-CoA transferase